MYLVRTVTDRTRNRTLLARLRGGADPRTGQALVADALHPGLAAVAGTAELEALRRRLVENSTAPVRPRLGADDFKGALGVFLLVVAATFPVVVPFMVFDQTAVAVRVSNAVALGMLFLAGWVLARYAGGNRWRGGAAMAATGAVLIAAIIALGG
jgi:VIT1/CCC1 family predicted Fe2+/Mn2+ transporter